MLIYNEPLVSGQLPLIGHLPLPQAWPLIAGSTVFILHLFLSLCLSDFRYHSRILGLQVIRHSESISRGTSVQNRSTAAVL